MGRDPSTALPSASRSATSLRMTMRVGKRRSLTARLRLILLDQIADALGVGFAVAVAGDGVGAAGGFDDNLGPEHAGGNVHGSDFRHGDAFFVAAEQARLHAGDALRTDDQASGEEEVAGGPAAGGEGLGGRRVHGINGESGHNFVLESGVYRPCGTCSPSIGLPRTYVPSASLRAGSGLTYGAPSGALTLLFCSCVARVELSSVNHDKQNMADFTPIPARLFSRPRCSLRPGWPGRSAFRAGRTGRRL